MFFPNIKYYISTQKYKKDKDKDVYTLFIAKEIDDDIQGIIVIPEDNKERSNIDGKNIEFTKNLIRYKGEEFCFDELAIGYSENCCFLILESNLQKLWYLPDEVKKFLDLDIVLEENYALSINNKIPVIISYGKRNTIPQENIIISTKDLILRTQGGLSNEEESYTVSFIYFDSEDINEQFEKSYFYTYNSKYYFNECYLFKNENKIGLYSNKLIYNEKVISDKITPCLGYIEI